MISRAELSPRHLGVTDEQPSAVVVDRAVEALALRAQTGDGPAFAALVSRFEKKLLAICWRLLGDKEDALDAAQESFLRAHKYLGGYAGPDFGAWLHVIALNVCRESAKRRPPRSEAAAPQEPVAEGDPELHAAARDDRRVLERALGTLTAKERAAFALRDLEGRSTEEVARLLGSSPTTVRVHVCMARKKIRRFLDENGSTPGDERRDGR